MIEIYIILVELTGGVNLGLITRLLENFDAKEIRLVNPRISDDEMEKAWIFSARARRSLEDKVIIYKNLDSAMKDLQYVFATSAVTSNNEKNILRIALSPEKAARVILEGNYNKVGIVFGRETTGLTVEEIGKCDMLININSSPEYRALNISNSVAIILYEFYNILSKKRKLTRKISDRNLVIRTINYYKDTLIMLTEDREFAYKVGRALHNIFSRGAPRKKEINLLISGMRKIYIAIREYKRVKKGNKN